MSRHTIAVAYGFLFLAADVFAAAPPWSGRDWYGDPLPPGAVARFGTLRCRASGGKIVVSPDARVMIVFGDEGLRGWEIESGRAIAWLPQLKDVEAARILADGRTLVTVAASKDRDPFEESWSFQRWRWGSGTPIGKPVVVTEKERRDTKAWVWSHDGKWLLLAGYSSPTVLFNALTGERVWAKNQIRGGSFTPDGKCLVLISETGGLHAHDPLTGKRVRQLAPDPTISEEFGYHSVVPSPDGKAVVGVGRCLQRFELDTGKPSASIEGYHDACAFTRDGTRLATMRDKVIRVYDGKTFRLLHAWPHTLGGFGEVVQFSDDGSRLVLRAGASVRVWDVKTGKLSPLRPAHLTRACAVAFSVDGKRLATGSWDGTARTWDVATSRQLHCFEGHPFEVRSVAFSPDGKTLATGDGVWGNKGETAVRLFDLASGRQLRRFPAHVKDLMWLLFSPDGKQLATAGLDDRIRLWDVASGRRLGQVRDLRLPVPLAFVDGGKSLLVSEYEEGCHLFDVKTLRPLDRPNVPRDRNYPAHTYLPRQRQLLTVTTFQPQTEDRFALRRLRATRRDMTGKVVHSVEIPIEQFTCISPDGKSLVRDAGGAALELWDLDSGKPFASFDSTMRYRDSVAFSPDGRWLATSGDSGIVLLWDVEGLRLDGAIKEVLVGKGDARRLAHDPVKAVLRLSLRLLAFAKSQERYGKLIRDLDDDDFDVREKASAGLQKLGPEAAGALKEAARDGVSAEIRRRAQALLQKLTGSIPPPTMTSEIARHVLAVLARMNTPAATAALDDLAKRHPTTQVGIEAKKHLTSQDQSRKER